MHREPGGGGRHLVVATPVSGPSDGGTSVIISLAGGGFGGAQGGGSAGNGGLVYQCAFGHVVRSGEDEMLREDGGGRAGELGQRRDAASRRRLRMRALAT